MSHRFLASAGVLAIVIVVVSLAAVHAAQTQTARGSCCYGHVDTAPDTVGRP